MKNTKQESSESNVWEFNHTTTGAVTADYRREDPHLSRHIGFQLFFAQGRWGRGNQFLQSASGNIMAIFRSAARLVALTPLFPLLYFNAQL